MKGLLNTRMSALLAAIGGLLAVAPTAQASRLPQVGRLHRMRYSNAMPRRSSGKHYPEQSSRQALRGARRAQGGPGIDLINNAYVVRGQ